MSRFLKNISLVLFWLAGLALTAHQVIPHDHHTDNLSVNEEQSCPVKDNDSNHHSGFPVHCHAFNDMTTEKSRAFQIGQNIHFCFNAFGIAYELPAFKAHFTSGGLIAIPKTAFESYTLELSLLRAPPAIV